MAIIDAFDSFLVANDSRIQKYSPSEDEEGTLKNAKCVTKYVEAGSNVQSV